MFDEYTFHTYDANDRLLIERLDDDADETIEFTTTYAYGGGADFSNPSAPFGGDHTTQTEKAVRCGTATSGTTTSRVTYEYDATGRMVKTESFSGGSGTPDSTTTYKYNDSGLRVSQMDVA